jgi:hypothetical protein
MAREIVALLVVMGTSDKIARPDWLLSPTGRSLLAGAHVMLSTPTNTVVEEHMPIL